MSAHQYVYGISWYVQITASDRQNTNMIYLLNVHLLIVQITRLRMCLCSA